MMIRRHPLLAFFVLAYAISWIIWAPLWLPRLGVHGLPVLPFHHALGALGPISAAFIVSTVESGRAGAVDLMRRMGFWRNRIGWIVFALCGPLVMLAFSQIGEQWYAAHPVDLIAFARSREFPQFSGIGFLTYNILTFGYGEETGWRGFALPRLQARHSALASTLILTGGWALWHVPLFLYRPGYLMMSGPGIVGWLFSLLTGAVLLTWLFNESRGSVLAVAFFHAAVDVAFTSDRSSPLVVNAAGAVITLLGIVVLLVAGPKYLSRTGFVVRSREVGRVIDFVARNGAVVPNDS
ncbi:MAG: CPBP family intramembrane glutamic endopeptidase [Gemmatimonas sp.]